MSKKRKQKKSKFQFQDLNVKPLNSSQDRLIHSIKHNQMTVTTGVAGTGKTYVPTVLSAREYVKGRVDKIILSRPNVEAGRPLGYRPGDLQEKLREWFAEIFSIYTRLLGPGFVETGLKNGTIELVPFESMRGRNFDDAFIILDEAQNTLPVEMKMFSTRIGEGTTVVINGDMNQSDISAKSGLKVFCDLIELNNLPIPMIEFGVDDIVRSELCRDLIVAWDKYERETMV